MIVFNTFVSASDMVVLLLCRKLLRFPQGYVLDELRQQPDNSTIPNLFPTQQRRNNISRNRTPAPQLSCEVGRDPIRHLCQHLFAAP